MTFRCRRGNSRVALLLLAAMATTPALAGTMGTDATPGDATMPAQLSAPELPEEAAPQGAGPDSAAATVPGDPAQASGADTPGVFGKVGRAIGAGARSLGAWLGSVGEGDGETAAAKAGAAPVSATDADAPTLANARWIGFAPAVYTGGDPRPGAWIAGPFDQDQRTGWITDTATGATARVTLIWREATQGAGAAALSEAAAQALGLRQGDVANLAVYLSR